MHYGEARSGSALAAASELTPGAEQARDTVNVYLRQVQPFLARRQGRYDFFYESLKIAALTRYVGNPSPESPYRRTAQCWHGRIAAYFQRLPLQLSGAPAGQEIAAQSARPNVRKLDELPWQQMRAEQWSDLETTLCDLEFLQVKVEAGLEYEVANDYELAESLLTPDGNGDSSGGETALMVRRFAVAFNQEFHAFQRLPHTTA